MFGDQVFAQSYRTATEINSAMMRVYKYMMLAMAVSGLVAMGVAGSAELMQFFFTGWTKWIVLFLPLVLIFVITPALASDIPIGLALGLLMTFAAAMGLSTASIFVVYTSASIIMAFVSTIVLFGCMTFYGYFTKRDLNSIGQFLMIGLIAIIIASIINIFVGSNLATMVISALAIVIFLGLTAYDSQRIRNDIMENVSSSAEVLGALSLYLNFINIFLSLLQLTGSKNE
jgi:FtsH-binding integral membrane protein